MIMYHCKRPHGNSTRQVVPEDLLYREVQNSCFVYLLNRLVEKSFNFIYQLLDRILRWKCVELLERL